MERNVKLVAILATLMLIFGVVNETFAQKGSVPYAVFENGTLTFYYGKNKPEGAFSMRDTTNYGKTEWYHKYAKIKTVVFDKSFKKYRPTSCAYWFSGCCSLTKIVGMRENLNTSDVTTMEAMFETCFNLESLDVSNFNTEKVTNMNGMFRFCEKLTSLDVSNFNTENVTDMSEMFEKCSSLTSLDVSNFNTENVTDMSSMFWECSSLTSLDVSNFNTENVTDMRYMFCDCSNLKTIYVSEG